jgi:hypothetical protein
MTEMTRECLELAMRNCVGRYDVRHIVRMRELAKDGLVKSVKTETGAWYELTEAGFQALVNDSGLVLPSEL